MLIDMQTIGIAKANREPAKHTLTPINDIGISKAQKKQGRHGRVIRLTNNLQRQKAIHIQMPTQRHIPRATREVAQHNPSSPTPPIIPNMNSNIGGMMHMQMIKLIMAHRKHKNIIRHINIMHVSKPILSISPYLID